MQRRFAAGEILLREGDPSDSVVLVQAGRVEVLRSVGDEGILLGSAGPGEFIGEMGVLDGRARSATVRAATEVTAELVGREAFLLRISRDPALAHKLLLRMSARLRHVEDLLAAWHAAARVDGEARVSPAGPWAIELRAVTFAAKFYVGVEPIAISQLPFTVGRRAGPDDGSPTLDLAIAEPAPYRLSPLHFRLYAEDGQLWLRDLRSALGTIVNQVALGQDFPIDSVPLRRGANSVVAGGVGSPFVFEVTLA
jgi:CRP/FNR family transcriptional regulator, cyclic AMP receptor protein